MPTDRPIAARERTEDHVLDRTLRPKRLREYIGQEQVKKNLTISLAAAKKRKEPLEHVLLHGAPGLGKTTLAHVIANELNTSIRVTSGPAIERAGDLAAILTNLAEGDVLFIDEIHRLNKTIEEVLYPAMEEHALDLVVGKGPSARTLRLELPRFTLVGATTRVSMLSAPLRDRFGLTFRLDFYEDGHVEEIVMRSAKLLNVPVDSKAGKAIASRSRKTPRVANRLLKRVRDYVEVKSDGRVTPEKAVEALEHLAIDELGLDETDRRILNAIIETFKGGPAGLNAIASAVGEEMETIEDIYEPYLLQLGFLSRTPRGRVVTERGYRHLKKEPPPNLQQKLV